MALIEFELESCTAGGILTGRNGGLELPVGTKFTAVVRERFSEAPGAGAVGDHVESVLVELVVMEVQCWNQPIAAAPPAYSAGLRVEGEGLVKLAQALQSRGKREVVYVRGQRDAQPFHRAAINGLRPLIAPHVKR